MLLARRKCCSRSAILCVEQLEARCVPSSTKIIEIEPNNVQGSGQLLPSVGRVIIEGKVSDSFFGDLDHYRFHGKEGQQININFHYPQAPGSSPLAGYEGGVEIFRTFGHSVQATGLIPPGETSASLETVISSDGVYTIRVSAFGPHEPVNSFSFFGFTRGTGSYTLTVNLSEPPPPPDIIMQTAELVDERTIGLIYEITEDVGAFDVRVYKSKDPIFDSQDLMIQEAIIVPTGDVGNGTVILTDTSPRDSSYPYLLVVADPNNTISEIDESNNSVAFQPDTDGDGLLDLWETKGLDIDGDGIREFKLSDFGADPLKKDIFVEIDYMQSQSHSHQLAPAAIEQVLNAFANAPVQNPDGTTGIVLHVDAGPDSLMDPGPDNAWGTDDDLRWKKDFSKATSIAEIPVLGSFTIEDGVERYQWTEFDTLKAQHFSTARHEVFHYAISGHDLGYPPRNYSGISRNSASVRKGASDFLITLGDVQSEYAQAGVLMHELGHNLGLRHGGDDHKRYEPNYFSIMNYAFVFTGLIQGEQGGLFDYSRFGPRQIPPLNERALDEALGINASARLDGFGTRYYLGTTDNVLEVSDVNGPIDWNRNGVIDQNKVKIDINGNNVLNKRITGGFNDWASLVFDGGQIGGAVDVAADQPQITRVIEEGLTPEELPRGHFGYEVSMSGPWGASATPGASVILEYQIENIGEKPDVYRVWGKSIHGWADFTSLPKTVTLAPGELASVSVMVTFPGDSSDQSGDLLELFVESQNKVPMSDSAHTHIDILPDEGPSGIKINGVDILPNTTPTSGEGDAPHTPEIIPDGAGPNSESPSSNTPQLLAPTAGISVANNHFIQTETSDVSKSANSNASIFIRLAEFIFREHTEIQPHEYEYQLNRLSFEGDQLFSTPLEYLTEPRLSLLGSLNTDLIGDISGTVFLDWNKDGDRNNGEPPVIGGVVFIDENNNGHLDSDEIWVLTDENGEYQFSSLQFGSYSVRFPGQSIGETTVYEKQQIITLRSYSPVRNDAHIGLIEKSVSKDTQDNTQEAP